MHRKTNPKAIAFTCSKRSCRVWKDLDRSRVCRNVHAVNMALHTARDSASTAISDQTQRSVRIRLLWKIRCIVARAGRSPFWSFHVNHCVRIPREHPCASPVGPVRESFPKSERKCSGCKIDPSKSVSAIGIWRRVYCTDRVWHRWHSILALSVVNSAVGIWILFRSE